jgi:hypothetical protein
MISQDLHSLVCTQEHLERIQAYRDNHDVLRIIHILWDDLYDRYIVLVRCSPATLTMLTLLC